MKTRDLTADERKAAAKARQTQSAVDALVHRDRRWQQAAMAGRGLRRAGEPKGRKWD